MTPDSIVGNSFGERRSMRIGNTFVNSNEKNYPMTTPLKRSQSCSGSLVHGFDELIKEKFLPAVTKCDMSGWDLPAPKALRQDKLLLVKMESRVNWDDMMSCPDEEFGSLDLHSHSHHGDWAEDEPILRMPSPIGLSPCATPPLKHPCWDPCGTPPPEVQEFWDPCECLGYGSESSEVSQQPSTRYNSKGSHLYSSESSEVNKASHVTSAYPCLLTNSIPPPGVFALSPTVACTPQQPIQQPTWNQAQVCSVPCRDVASLKQYDSWSNVVPQQTLQCFAEACNASRLLSKQEPDLAHEQRAPQNTFVPVQAFIPKQGYELPLPAAVPMPPQHATKLFASPPTLLLANALGTESPYSAALTPGMLPRKPVPPSFPVMPPGALHLDARSLRTGSKPVAEAPAPILVQQEAEATEIVQEAGKVVTTLMIRNLPRQISQLCLIDELNKSGFAGTYDFAYMPQSFHGSENSGFAFINFIKPSTAATLVADWHRQRLFGMNTKQAPLNISVADVQGLAANVQKWATPRLRRIRNLNLRPFVLDESTKTLRSLTDSEFLLRC